jgi:hypothetical protein
MSFQIRKASLKDASFFYELRNEKIAKKNSFANKNIYYNDHLKWYKSKLRQKNAIFLIALQNNCIGIGTVRYEIEDIFANISINISKKFRRLGYGSKILKKSEKFLKQKLIIISKIKKKNKASLKIFKKNNYKVFRDNPHTILIKIT